MEYYISYVIHVFWLEISRPGVKSYFLRIQMLGNLDLSPWDIFFICNPNVLGTNIVVQCNVIFCESRISVILVCPRVISLSYVTIMCWVKILRPCVIAFLQIQMLGNFELPHGILCSYVITMYRVQISIPSVIVFPANPDFD